MKDQIQLIDRLSDLATSFEQQVCFLRLDYFPNRIAVQVMDAAFI
jgi:hypothetical protein